MFTSPGTWLRIGREPLSPMRPCQRRAAPEADARTIAPGSRCGCLLGHHSSGERSHGARARARDASPRRACARRAGDRLRPFSGIRSSRRDQIRSSVGSVGRAGCLASVGCSGNGKRSDWPPGDRKSQPSTPILQGSAPCGSSEHRAVSRDCASDGGFRRDPCSCLCDDTRALSNSRDPRPLSFSGLARPMARKTVLLIGRSALGTCPSSMQVSRSFSRNTSRVATCS